MSDFREHPLYEVIVYPLVGLVLLVGVVVYALFWMPLYLSSKKIRQEIKEYRSKHD